MLRLSLYLVDGTRGLLPVAAAAGLHHVADVFSGCQQLGCVHGGLRPQTVSPGLVGPGHAVHPHLQKKEEYQNYVILSCDVSINKQILKYIVFMFWIC